MGLVEQFLLEGIEAGDLDAIRLEHRRGAQLHLCEASFTGDNAIQVAIKCGNAAAVALLCTLYKPDTFALLKTSANSLGRLAVHTACRRGEFECLQVLMGIDPELASIPTVDERKAFPLHFVAEHCRGKEGVRMALLLLENGAEVLAKESSALTALNVAARHDNTEVLDVLLQASRSAECACVGSCRSTIDMVESPLLSAVRGCALLAAKMLIDVGFCIHEQVAGRGTILEEARLCEDVHLADKLVEHTKTVSPCSTLEKE